MEISLAEGKITTSTPCAGLYEAHMTILQLGLYI